MFIIKKIEEKDLAQLGLLYEQLSGNPSQIEKMKKVFLQMNENPHYSLFGAFNSNNELVGSIMGLLCYDLAMDCQPIYFMENMIVEKSWRKKGVGKALMLKIEEIAKEKDCLFLQYCSSQFRKEAHLFYESLGYAPDAVKGYRKFFGNTRVRPVVD